jgi:hypothetical protein
MGAHNKALFNSGHASALSRALFVSGPGPALKNNLFFSGAREPAWDVQPSHGCYNLICKLQKIAVAVASLT